MTLFESNLAPESWVIEFNKLKTEVEKRFLRQQVYRTTYKTVVKGFYFSPRGTRFFLPSIHTIIDNTIVFKDPIIVDADKERLSYDSSKISVVNGDCLVEAGRLVKKGYKTAVLNMASSSKPGGGVLEGAGAQEENIFRRTSIFPSLIQFHNISCIYGIPKANELTYPLKLDGAGILSKDVTVFRGDETKGYPFLDNPYQVDVISVAAVNKSKDIESYEFTEKDIETTKNKVSTIFNIAISNGNEAIVLSAFGCGAYHNSPYVISRIFKELLYSEKYRKKFKEVIFAILDDNNSPRIKNPQGNYLPFKETFENNNPLSDE